MRNHTIKNLIRLTALLLVFVLAVPMEAAAAVQEPVMPMASDYFKSYNGYTTALGSGRIGVSFTVNGVNKMDKLGSTSIAVYESTDNATFTYVATFWSSSYSSMMGQNTLSHGTTLSYSGTAGRYYKAYINIRAEKDGGYATRGYWTNTTKAT